MQNIRVLPLAALLLSCSLIRPAEAARSQPAPRGMSLDVDLTEAPRRVFHAREKLDAQAGTLALLFPKWIPGEHGPTGPITDVAGLVFTQNGKPLTWRRDPIEMYRFLVDVPAAGAVEVALDQLSAPPGESGFSQGASATQNLALLSWNQVLLYPEGASPQEFIVHSTLVLPKGWSFGTSLPIEAKGERISFAAVPLETLIDSPVLAGAHFREVPIGPSGGAPHFLELAAETESELAISPDYKKAVDQLVAEQLALYGAHHYESYRFLVTLSDSTAHFGLEHHQSSDDRVPERALLDPELRMIRLAGLLPHEYTHSWNGKYRRPAGLATRDYQQPMQGELLWVYEGLTEYLGWVLATRSGAWSAETAREKLAFTWSLMEDHRGRTWRPLDDTTTAAQLLYEAREDWGAWRRGVDFYLEGNLLWLEVDSIIREKSGGKKSLDDFCKRFHGGQSGKPTVVTYGFDDVVAALTAVAPNDWRAFLKMRVSELQKDPPPGPQQSGWKVVYSDQESGYQQAFEKVQKFVDLRGSVGLTLDAEKSTVVDVMPGKAADKAGIAPGMKLIAVNGHRYSAEDLRTAVAQTKEGGKLDLLVDNAETFSTHSLDYHDGARYPRLERDASRPDLLTAILLPAAAPH